MKHIGVSGASIENFVKSRGKDAQTLVEFAGRMCYDAETEVLTTSGWTRGMNLTGGEKVATLNPDTGVVEFQPHRPWRYDYLGTMLSVEHQHISLLVTPEHRMYVQTAGRNYGIVEARHLNAFQYRFRLAGSPVLGEPKPVFEIPPAEITQTVANQHGKYGRSTRTIGGLAIPSGAYLKLAGYYLSEGHVYQQPGSGAGIGLTQTEGPVLADMISAVKHARLPFGVYPDPRKPRVKFLHVGGGRAVAAHFTRFGMGSRNKTIPRGIMTLDPSSLQILYDAMWMGDGHTNESGARVYNTVSEKLADDVQELLFRLGIASSMHSYPLNGRPYFFVKELRARDSPVIYPKHRRWVRYSGPVWCVSTENGILLVRRNKKPVWCGNCYESYEPRLNPNVTRIRGSPKEYFENIIRSGDGSILEHGWQSFALIGISRIASHEIVRHRVGTAISQESLRYVRPREIRFWIPDELAEDQAEAMRLAVEHAESAYRKLEDQIPWDKLPMQDKKRLTSALRRILPDGIATNMIWSANHRTLRWLIEMRTDPAAEVEIRIVFNQIADICIRDYPYLYGDFTATVLPDGTRSFKPALRSKV
ncbi:MAG: FAD-dependent thymidylate synthase [Methanobacteriota archaeon]